MSTMQAPEGSEVTEEEKLPIGWRIAIILGLLAATWLILYTLYRLCPIF